MPQKKKNQQLIQKHQNMLLLKKELVHPLIKNLLLMAMNVKRQQQLLDGKILNIMYINLGEEAEQPTAI